MKFSVSMSVYENDSPIFFKAAFDSILNQTIIPSEVVLVVDGPIPNSLKDVVITFEKDYEDIIVIWLDENKGHGLARKIGVENCSHEIVALMDSDDLSVPDRFEKQIDCLKNDPALSIVGGYIEEFLDNPENKVGLRVVPLSNDKILHNLKLRSPMNQVSVMFRKSDVISAGGYLDWHFNEDYYLWIRMFLKGCTFKNIPETLVKVRIGKNMYRRRGGIKYFVSEYKLQKFMLLKKIISIPRFIINVMMRFLLQIIFTSSLRAFIFRKFARKGLENV
jgi:glycosyltransferase involved in cell wall biosynthesis